MDGDRKIGMPPELGMGYTGSSTPQQDVYALFAEGILEAKATARHNAIYELQDSLEDYRDENPDRYVDYFEKTNSSFSIEMDDPRTIVRYVGGLEFCVEFEADDMDPMSCDRETTVHYDIGRNESLKDETAFIERLADDLIGICTQMADMAAENLA